MKTQIHAPWPWKNSWFLVKSIRPLLISHEGSHVLMILKFLFFIWTFLKHCKALSTEKYRLYIDIFIILLFSAYRKAVTTSALRSVPKRLKPHISLHQESLTRNHTLWLRGRMYRQLTTSPTWVVHGEEWCASMLISTTGLLRPASPLEDCVRMSGSEKVSASPLSGRSTMQ